MLSSRKVCWVISVIILFVLAGGQAIASDAAANLSGDTVYFSYLPVTANRALAQTRFGIQVDVAELAKGIPYMVDLGSSFVRFNSLDWSVVEPNKGDRLWSEIGLLEASLRQVSLANMEALLIVHRTPSWAQTVEGATCSRIRDEALDEFGDFLYDAVLRYSYPPYNVMYWEIWNEPDIGYSEDLANMPFGCWADYSDEVWGGEYYAEVLKAIYPRIKEANPNAQVIIGGLHLDCDPRGDPSYCELMDSNPGNPLYLTGILEAGGGDYFDGVGFHAYDYYTYWEPELGSYVNNHWGSGWDTTGPVINAKADYIRQVLDEFGVEDKFLVNTEGSLICGPIDDWYTEEGCESTYDSLYEQTKARYVTQLYASAIASDLKADIWHTLFYYRHAELVDGRDLTLRPAYFSYQVVRQMLKNGSFIGELELQSEVMGYEFLVDDERVWLLWSLDGQTHTIDLAEMPKIMYDYMGEAVTPVNPLTITIDPLFVVWSQ